MVRDWLYDIAAFAAMWAGVASMIFVSATLMAFLH